jgi:hypothetical protein
MLLPAQDRLGHPDGLDRFQYIMRADDLHAVGYCQSRAGKRTWQAFIHAAP